MADAVPGLPMAQQDEGALRLPPTPTAPVATVDDGGLSTMSDDDLKTTYNASTQLAGMSDADLVSELSKQANELGVKIDLSYKFGEDD